MKVSTIPPQPESSPDILIQISWEEARILRSITGGLGGIGLGRDFINELNSELEYLGIYRSPNVSVSGTIKS